METWYQVWYLDNGVAKVFGFSAYNGIIAKHPDWSWRNKPLHRYKPYLLRMRAVVTKINP